MYVLLLQRTLIKLAYSCCTQKQKKIGMKNNSPLRVENNPLTKNISCNFKELVVV